MITASLSTIAWREPGLATAVGSILPQVDRLNVFLQGYGRRVPDCLKDRRVVVARDDEHTASANLGASAKYHWLWRGEVADGYHIVIDDDILYPPDYVQFCIRKIEEYGRRAVVGFHGAIYNAEVRSYFRDRQLWAFGKACDADRFVHMLGTGTTAHHTGALPLSMSDFGAANSCDLFLGIACQRRQIPMVCLERPEGYLRALPLASDPRAASGPESYAARMVELHASIPEWRIHEAPRTERADAVAVIIPCYNEQQDRLERTVESALALPGVDIVRVVDDGSRVPVHLEPRDRLEVVHRHTNGGPSAALNTGIRSLPKDTIICRLDVGDVFYPESKVRQIALAKSGVPAICSWRYDPVEDKTRQIEPGWERQIFFDCPFAATATIFHKSVWLEIGGFNEDLRWADDWWFSAMVQAYVGWTAFHEVTGEHGMHPGGHSDVSGDPRRAAARAKDVTTVTALCRALGEPEKNRHLFDETWCRKRGIKPLRRPK